MANGNREPENSQPIQQKKAKQPYLKPTFRFEQVFVTSALTCGKIDSTEFTCRSNRRIS